GYAGQIELCTSSIQIFRTFLLQRHSSRKSMHFWPISAAFLNSPCTERVLQLDDHRYFYPTGYNNYSKNVFVMAVKHCNEHLIEVTEHQGTWVSKNLMRLQRNICRNVVAQYQFEHVVERSRRKISRKRHYLGARIKEHPSLRRQFGPAKHMTNATACHLTDRSTAEKSKFTPKPGYLDYTNICENFTSGPLLAVTDITWQLPSEQSCGESALLRHPAVSRDTTNNGNEMRTLIWSYVLTTRMLPDQEAVHINGNIRSSVQMLTVAIDRIADNEPASQCELNFTRWLLILREQTAHYRYSTCAYFGNPLNCIRGFYWSTMEPF
ncbi:hypothetical protein CSKR_101224, partial [Clonorchis sinensis]